MLRELTILVLVLNAGLLFFANLKTAAILLILLAIFVYSLKRTYSHIIGKELSYLAARLAQLMPAILAIYILIFIFGNLGIKDLIPFYAATCLAITPSLLPLILGAKVSRSESKIGLFRATRILRCLLGSMGAQLFLILIGLIGLFGFHLLPAITIPQLVALQFMIALPLMALSFDKSPHKLLQATDHNFRVHTTSKKSFKSYLGYGFVTALIAYANFFLLFARHNLNPYYLDPSLPLYKQATTLALATLIICLFLNIIFERVEKHEFFINEHTLENKKLLKTFGFSTIVLVVIIYAPYLQDVFNTQPLSAIDWLTVLGAGMLYISARMTKRHTRKHSRHAVIKLHKQLNS